MARGSQGGSQGGAGGVPARERYFSLKDVSGLTAETEALANDKAIFQVGGCAGGKLRAAGARAGMMMGSQACADLWR